MANNIENQSIGERFRLKREYMGYSINDVAALTNLRSTVIDAIETGDFEHYPPKGFVVNILSSYAKFLDLNENEILQDYEIELGAYLKQVKQQKGKKDSPHKSNRFLRVNKKSEIEQMKDEVSFSNSSRQQASSVQTSGNFTHTSSIKIISKKPRRGAGGVGESGASHISRQN
ncbi:MAG: helix-turn-helix domain-containing protein, partial [Coriobacteriales bacterium]|nr:helix-turn-helix domain-containing protein [Coriobacteriales bacterium]